MKIDHEWLQGAIDIASQYTTLKVVHPSGKASVESENGVLRIEITGDME